MKVQDMKDIFLFIDILYIYKSCAWILFFSKNGHWNDIQFQIFSFSN
jgi:hypothetical protein